MATTTTRNGKKVTLTIEQKAALLQVIEVNATDYVAVRSGSDARVAYAVYHNGKAVTGCACTGCKQYGRKQCAYRQAVAWYLEARNRNAYCSTFSIYE